MALGAMSKYYYLCSVQLKLYQPTDIQLTTEQYIALHQRFVLGHKKFKDMPEVQHLYEQVRSYKNELDNLGLRDGHIEESTAINGFQAFWLVTVRFVLCVVTLVLALPGFVLNLPIGITARKLAQKHQKEALAASEVKISGLDVVASKKVTIAIVLTPPLYIFYSSIVWWLFGNKAAILTFFGLFALTSATIRCAEEGLSMARSLRAIFKIRWIGSKMTDLSRQRKSLQAQIRDIVSRLGPELREEGESFENWRIIKEEQIKADHPGYTPNLTGRGHKPFKTINPWDTPISEEEWKEMQEVQEATK